MKVSIVTNNDGKGGAARAAFRLLKSMQQQKDINANMYVRIKYTDETSVIAPNTNFNKLVNLLRAPANTIFNKLSIRNNINYHSNNILPSNMHQILNKNDADIINLHWLGAETMSIKDIGLIKKPVVWTLHDMWAFCGAEHVTDYEGNTRWKVGYTKKNRNILDKRLDLDKLTWEKKLKHWKTPMHIVTPSNWLATCAKESFLFKDWPISVIPNPINTQIYKPLNKTLCREILNLPLDKKIILFGAIGGSKNNNKGFDLLLNSLKNLSSDSNIDSKNIICVIFGQSKPIDTGMIPFESIWLGHINDDITLSLIYNSADVMVVPSRIENFPQSVTEAQACGIPTIGFNTSGVSNAIIHNETGYLASPYDELDLSKGITDILLNAQLSTQLSNAAATRAKNLWSYEVVSKQYIDLFNEILL